MGHWSSFTMKFVTITTWNSAAFTEVFHWIFFMEQLEGNCISRRKKPLISCSASTVSQSCLAEGSGMSSGMCLMDGNPDPTHTNLFQLVHPLVKGPPQGLFICPSQRGLLFTTGASYLNLANRSVWLSSPSWGMSSVDELFPVQYLPESLLNWISKIHPYMQLSSSFSQFFGTPFENT